MPSSEPSAPTVKYIEYVLHFYYIDLFYSSVSHTYMHSIIEQLPPY